MDSAGARQRSASSTLTQTPLRRGLASGAGVLAPEVAAAFKKTLSGWRRSTKFCGYREAGEFGRKIGGWLDQVAREQLPRDPRAALSLFESFVEADTAWFERADDSDGVIGDAAAAESRLVADAGRIDGSDYVTLVPLAKALRARECLRAETVVNRACGALLGSTVRDQPKQLQSAAAQVARGIRGRGPRASRTQGVLLDTGERKTHRPGPAAGPTSPGGSLLRGLGRRVRR